MGDYFNLLIIKHGLFFVVVGGKLKLEEKKATYAEN